MILKWSVPYNVCLPLIPTRLYEINIHCTVSGVAFKKSYVQDFLHLQNKRLYKNITIVYKWSRNLVKKDRIIRCDLYWNHEYLLLLDIQARKETNIFGHLCASQVLMGPSMGQFRFHIYISGSFSYKRLHQNASAARHTTKKKTSKPF